MSNGKGDKNRTTSYRKYFDNYDKAFKKSKEKKKKR